jgi:hypothetical protein
MTTLFRLVVPTGLPADEVEASMHAERAGRSLRLVLVDNTKPSTKEVLQAAAAKIGERLPVAGVHYLRKGNAAAGIVAADLPPELFNHEEVAVGIAGIGD